MIKRSNINIRDRVVEDTPENKIAPASQSERTT